ncbi:MAG: RNA polymerase subunit sigma-70 [Chloroflexi bacterium]|nr:MAG: RNA polymerase subunit sigma-70 [Chloroflexota bacterium]HDN79529.1 sigma-70 family RNA polymerase sigma factor [Chloroflexota bacterium]
MSDEELLLKRASRNDPAALAQIYDTYAAKIYNYIYHRTGDHNVAEDLTADVFLRMLEAIRKGHPPRVSISAWLYRIAHNLVVDYFRQRPGETTIPLDERLVAADVNVAVEKRLARQQLLAAISRLTPDQQQVIVLKFMEGLSNAEVAQILGKTEGAVKALQHRALNSLRQILRGK